MNMALERAARRLQTILQQENEALRRGDTTAAVSYSVEKAQACQAVADAGPPARYQDELGRRLMAMATENGQLLEEAIQIQTRIVEIVARAAHRADRAAPSYGARGYEPTETSALALVTRA